MAVRQTLHRKQAMSSILSLKICQSWILFSLRAGLIKRPCGRGENALSGYYGDNMMFLWGLEKTWDINGDDMWPGQICLHQFRAGTDPILCFIGEMRRSNGHKIELRAKIQANPKRSILALVSTKGSNEKFESDI